MLLTYGENGRPALFLVERYDEADSLKLDARDRCVEARRAGGPAQEERSPGGQEVWPRRYNAMHSTAPNACYS